MISGMKSLHQQCNAACIAKPPQHITHPILSMIGTLLKRIPKKQWTSPPELITCSNHSTSHVVSSVSSSIIILCLLSLESLLYHVVTLPSDDVVCPISHYLSVYSQNGPLLQRKQVLLENGGFGGRKRFRHGCCKFVLRIVLWYRSQTREERRDYKRGESKDRLSPNKACLAPTLAVEWGSDWWGCITRVSDLSRSKVI